MVHPEYAVQLPEASHVIAGGLPVYPLPESHVTVFVDPYVVPPAAAE